jgi:hypothetical protein
MARAKKDPKPRRSKKAGMKTQKRLKLNYDVLKKLQ